MAIQPRKSTDGFFPIQSISHNFEVIEENEKKVSESPKREAKRSKSRISADVKIIISPAPSETMENLTSNINLLNKKMH